MLLFFPSRLHKHREEAEVDWRLSDIHERSFPPYFSQPILYASPLSL